MHMLQTVVANGYELALVVGGARGFGIPFHASFPQQVALAVAHTVDVALEFLVGVHRNMTGVIRV